MPMKQILTALAATVMLPVTTLLGGPPGVPGAQVLGLETRCTQGPPSTPQATRADGESEITLVTGEHVRLSTDPSGQVTTKVLPPAGRPQDGAPAFIKFDWAGDQYIVPSEAVPYLGSLLDPRLFDVSYLARAGLDDSRTSALPVTISYRAGQASLPGQRTTREVPGGAEATLSKSQATTLGAMLAADWRSLHAKTALSAADPMRAIGWIGLAAGQGKPPLPAAPSPRAMQAGPGKGTPPHYRTLTIRFIGTDGQPGAAVGWAQNLDDARYRAFEVPLLQGYPLIGQPGPVRLSVPDGTYSLQFSVLTPHPGAKWGVDAALVVDPQVTVTADTTVTIDARAAKPFESQISPAVPSTYRMDQLIVDRASAGQACDGLPSRMGLMSWTTQGNEGSTLMATPTPAVRAGGLHFLAATEIMPGDDRTPADGPRYYLAFPDASGIPASLSYQIPQAGLATVRERVVDPPSADCASTSGSSHSGGLFSPFIYTSWGSALQLDDEPSPGGVLAGDHVNYWYSAQPSLTRWQDAFVSLCGGLAEADNMVREITPGQQLSQVWDGAPVVPSPAAAPAATFFDPVASPFAAYRDLAPASRQDDLASLNLTLGDSDPSHFSALWLGGGPVPHNTGKSWLAFWRNGDLVTSSDDLLTSAFGNQIWPDGATLPLLPQPASYRLVWKATAGYGAETTTDWTFQSSPAGAGQVPSSLMCGLDATRPCSYLPLLFLSYDLVLDAHAQVSAGAPFQVDFSVLHQQGETPPAGVAADVAASFDGGKTWTTPVPATANGSNAFAATVSIPSLTATDGFMALRVTAHDAVGDSVSQTIIRALGLTG